MIFDNEFGRLERLLHDLAFRSALPQVLLADLESTLFGPMLAEIKVERPVFIAGLPRSGTTILLELLVASGRFATHRYRDMPFVFCPLLWNRFSRHFATDRTARERAHGDGIHVSGESPEAFEEMIWKRFWQGHYEEDRIRPWTAQDRNEEFDTFFEEHMKKVVAVNLRKDGQDLRYLSKNNANIGRLAAPPLPLHRGAFLVPYREPIQQAASLLKQHKRFSTLQRQDPFVRRYMAAIGHHDFGLELRPIDFDGWLGDAGDPNGLEFWIKYWTATYRAILTAARPQIRLVPYSRLILEGEAVLREVGEWLGMPSADLVSSADKLRAGVPHHVSTGELDPDVCFQAREVYGRLDQAALKQPR